MELLKQFSFEAFDEMRTSRAVHLVLIFNTLATFLALQSLHSTAASRSVSQSRLASLFKCGGEPVYKALNRYPKFDIIR